MTNPEPNDELLARQLREALRREASRHGLPPGFAALTARSMPDRTPAKRRGLFGLVVVTTVLIGALIVRGPDGTPPAGGSTLPASSQASVAPSDKQLRSYRGDGWGFSYPADWQFYPFQFTASFFDTIGYLASSPVDTTGICQHTSSEVTCNFRGYDLPPDSVVIELANWGPPLLDPIQRYDQPETGTRTTVGEMAAIFSEEELTADRVRLGWQIARPDAFGNWIQIDADIRGPGGDDIRRQVEALVASFQFDPPPQILPEGKAPATAIARAALSELKTREPAAYACFPTQPGTSPATSVDALPTETLRKPLPVTCSAAIERTDVGFWKLELVASWEAAADRAAGEQTTIQWLFPDGSLAASTGTGGAPDGYCCK